MPSEQPRRVRMWSLPRTRPQARSCTPCKFGTVTWSGRAASRGPPVRRARRRAHRAHGARRARSNRRTRPKQRRRTQPKQRRRNKGEEGRGRRGGAGPDRSGSVRIGPARSGWARVGRRNSASDSGNGGAQSGAVRSRTGSCRVVRREGRGLGKSVRTKRYGTVRDGAVSRSDPKGIRTPVTRMRTWCPGPG